MARKRSRPVGEALRAARLHAGLSIRDLGRLSGLSPSELSQIELGKRADPGFGLIARIAAALGLSLDALAADMVGKSATDTKATNAQSKVAALKATAQMKNARQNAERTIKLIDQALGLMRTTGKPE